MESQLCKVIVPKASIASGDEIVAYLKNEKFTGLQETKLNYEAYFIFPLSDFSILALHKKGWVFEIVSNRTDEKYIPRLIPQALGNTFYVAPQESATISPTNTRQKVIYLKTGCAFGDGSHPTTRMMVDLLEEALGNTVLRILDVGTGSGILAIAAAKLGCSEILALEVDEVACELANHNFHANSVERHIQLLRGSINLVNEPFDLVMANLFAAVLIGLKKDFLRTIKIGGSLLCSGILEDQGKQIEKAFSKNFTLRKKIQSGEWLSYHWVRDASN